VGIRSHTYFVFTNCSTVARWCGGGGLNFNPNQTTTDDHDERRGEQDYISKVAKTEKEICALIEQGFEYITEFEGARIFRKAKL